MFPQATQGFAFRYARTSGPLLEVLAAARPATAAEGRFVALAALLRLLGLLRLRRRRGRGRLLGGRRLRLRPLRGLDLHLLEDVPEVGLLVALLLGRQVGRLHPLLDRPELLEGPGDLTHRLVLDALEADAGDEGLDRLRPLVRRAAARQKADRIPQDVLRLVLLRHPLRQGHLLLALQPPHHHDIERHELDRGLGHLSPPIVETELC